MHAHWGSRMNATVYDLARHTTSLTKQKHGLHITEAPSHHDNAKNRRGNIGHKDSSVKTLIGIHRCGLNLLARMHFPLYLAPHWQTCSCCNNYGNTPHNEFFPHRQWSQSTIGHSAVSVCQAIAQPRNVKPSNLSFAWRSSIHAKPNSLKSLDDPEKYPSNPYRGQLPPKYGTTPTRQYSLNPSNICTTRLNHETTH